METIIKPKKVKAQAEVNERGQIIITKKYLRQLCEELELYETPHLNDKLFLHFKGFTKIENLEDYYNLKVLYLDHNLLKTIENLDPLVNLKALYLQNNLIGKIEGLDKLTNLVILNLSRNQITQIENLEHLINLQTIDLTYNELAKSVSLMGLKECPSLTSIDLSFNYIEYDDQLINVFSRMPNIACLYLKKNPICDSSGYRKMMLSALPTAKFLDDRAITDLERRLAAAWNRGGKEAEEEERKQYYAEKELQKEKTGEEREKNEKIRTRLQLEQERYEREAIEKRDKLMQKKEKVLEELPEDYESQLRAIDKELERTEEYLRERGKKQLAKLDYSNLGVSKYTCVSRTLNEKGEYVYTNNLSHDEVEQYRQQQSEEWNKKAGIGGEDDDHFSSDEKAAQDVEANHETGEGTSKTDAGVQEEEEKIAEKEKVEWNDELKGKLEEIVEDLVFDFTEATAVFNQYLKTGMGYKGDPILEEEIRNIYTSIEMEKYRGQ